MAYPEIIFPSSIYGLTTDKYGTNITAYNTAPNTTGFPLGTGLKLGMFGMLFDGSVVRLLKAGGTIAANDAVSPKIALSNDYTVEQTPGTANTYPVQGVSDRFGASLSANDYAWMTTYGIATCNVAASLTAPLFLVSSAVAGRLAAAAAGTSLQANIVLLNTSTTAGNYPVRII